MNTAEKATVDRVAVVALVFSIFSFIVSVRSCRITERQAELATQDYNAARRLVLKGEFDNDKDSLKLEPATSEVLLQTAKIYFPPRLNNKTWEPFPGDGKVFLAMVKNDLRKLLESEVETTEGHVSASTGNNIPVIIETLHTSKAESFFSRSLYFIKWDFVMSYEERYNPAITFHGLMYVARFDEPEDPHTWLDKTWDQGIKITSD